jgi:DNA repair exonuclease SbcCD ATPase subunit
MPTDWTSTSFPTETDLNEIAVRVAGLASVKQSARTLGERLRAADALRGGIEAVRRTVAELEQAMRNDPPDARQRHVRAQAEVEALGRRIVERRKELQKLEADRARLTTDQSAAQARRAEIIGKMEAERARMQLRDAARADAVARLPESWRLSAESAGLAELDGWKSERDRLRDAGVTERINDLAAARIQSVEIARQLATLEAEASATPESARVSPDEIDRQLASARSASAAAENAERAARDELVRLEGTLAQRRALAEQMTTVRRDHERHRKLAELLGRDRLQMHLVRRAERQIVEQANSVLDRISGGNLHLRRRDPGDDRDVALDLEVINRATSDEPIAAAFLSGSQRFRVAVSLALGIGRFASGQHRPIESVIIDEGFGCLDREGRQVMIQELQNLRSHMRRILLVSHQEEFVDAFADGYRFELVDGATRVTRVQR